MNYNDIDEIAFGFTKILLRQRLDLLNLATFAKEEKLVKISVAGLDPAMLAEEAYNRALAFQKEGRKHYVNPYLPPHQKEEQPA